MTIDQRRSLGAGGAGASRGTRAAWAISVVLMAGGIGCSVSERRRSAPAAGKAAKAVEPPRWPAMPAGERAAEALVKARTQRPTATAALTREGILAAVDEALAGKRRTLAGWPAILGELARINARARGRDVPHYLLFGSYHDAAGQLAAFRRVVGPSGIGRLLSHVVVEQLDADGRWAEIPLAEQQGDSQALRRWSRRGHRASLDALAQRQARGNYTAWKYGYLDEMTDLLAAVRAADRPLLGCDMPRPLQRRIAALSDELRDRLRELHCSMALGEASRETRRLDVAMFWGQSHVWPAGLPRFLPAKARVTRIQLFGHRPGQGTAERALAQRGLTVLDPVMIPPRAKIASKGAWILLLPGPVLGGAVDRARDPIGKPLVAAGRCRIQVTSTVAGRLTLGGKTEQTLAEQTLAERTLAVGRGAGRPETIEARPGRTLLRFVARGRSLVGALELPARGGVELELDPVARRLRVVYHPVVRRAE